MVTGTQGIGKSVFGIYLIYLILHDQKFKRKSIYFFITPRWVLSKPTNYERW